MLTMDTLLPFNVTANALELLLQGWFRLEIFDLLFIATAVVFNIQIMGIYIASKHKQDKLVRVFGVKVIALSVPLAIVYISDLVQGQELWINIAFLVIFVYLAVELLFDFILGIDFRSKPSLHIPYIILFYLVEFSFITIAFSISETSGYLVSISFWAMLVCLIYSLWPIRFRRGELR